MLRDNIEDLIEGAVNQDLWGIEQVELSMSRAQLNAQTMYAQRQQ